MRNDSQNYSFGDFIIAMLLSARSSRLYHKTLHERIRKNRSQKNIYTPLYRLKKAGYVTRKDDYWCLTELGRRKKTRMKRTIFIVSPFPKDAPKKILLAFDIPEKYKRERRWLRGQLKIFGYKMIQKSLWQGPGPLPKEFLTETNRLKIDKYFKLFSIKSK